jgi:hypothetical protein
VFEALEKFADKNMKKHLRFLRSMLGSGSTEPLSHLAKDFGITKQAMTWRARQLRAALGRVAYPIGVTQHVTQEVVTPTDHSLYKPRTTRDTYDDDFAVTQNNSNENIQRQTEGSSALQLQQLQRELPKKRRKIKRVSTHSLSINETKKERNRKVMAHTKQKRTRSNKI